VLHEQGTPSMCNTFGGKHQRHIALHIG